MNEKITMASDEKESVKQLYLNDVRLLRYDARHRRTRCTESTSAQEKYPSHEWESSLKELENRGFSIHWRTTGVRIVLANIREGQLRLEKRCSNRLSEKSTWLRFPHLHAVCIEKNSPNNQGANHRLALSTIRVYMQGRLSWRQPTS